MQSRRPGLTCRLGWPPTTTVCTCWTAAISKGGVAVIVIPGDVALLPAPDIKPAWVEQHPARVIPSESDLQRLVKLLDSSKAVTILAGAGCADAHDQVVALAEKLSAPVVHALRGKQYIEYANPFDVGMTGLIGFSSGYHAMMACDTLVILGSRQALGHGGHQ